MSRDIDGNGDSPTRGLGCRFEGVVEREVRLEVAIPLRVYALKTADVLEGQILADIARRHLRIYM